MPAAMARKPRGDLRGKEERARPRCCGASRRPTPTRSARSTTRARSSCSSRRSSRPSAPTRASTWSRRSCSRSTGPPPTTPRSPQGVLEREIRSTGFFNSKAKSIRAAGAAIAAEHGGRVPDTMEELVALPGVGRKTANVVLGNAFGKDEGFVVDTHVGRLSRRLGFTRQTDPVKVEHDLNALVPKGRRTLGAHLLIAHGRHDLRCPKAALRRVPGRAAVPENRRVDPPESSRPLDGNQFSGDTGGKPCQNPCGKVRKTRNGRSASEMHRHLCDSQSHVPSMI